MLKKSVIHIFLVTFLAVLLTGCRSSKATRVTAPSYSSVPAAHTGDKNDNKLDAPSEALLSEARSWLGVPYKYGGNDRSGVDCSGFVLQVYQRALDIPLPRTSREQHKYCTATSKERLIPGDLIFFASDKDRETVAHVGIFMGDNMMIHASTSKGVIISDITSSYYARNYAGSGVVERYHSMLGDKNRKKNSNKDKKKVPVSKEGPVIHISQSGSPAGFTLTPVDKLPEPVRKDAATSAAGTSEPTPEEARAAVLKSIKEKEL